MKIGIVKETKNPVDHRAPLDPKQIVELQKKYPTLQFAVQKSDVRAYHDEEYAQLGIEVKEDMSDCDFLMGIKEVALDHLLPNKHYLFFGHIAKMQPYNRPLIKKMIEQKITFSDYEYLVDESGVRVSAFGWWAGVVGVYNTLRGFGIKTGAFTYPKPDRKFTLDRLLSIVKQDQNYGARIIITGAGRVSQGAQHVLKIAGYQEVSNEQFLNMPETEQNIYTVADIDALLKHKENPAKPFDLGYYVKHKDQFRSDFYKFAKVANIFISCHFWGMGDPVYLSKEELAREDLKISFIGDVTCDIMGSIQSTLRASTHDEPYFDYNPLTAAEEPAFSNPRNITMMAVDTLPDALAMDTSTYFGETLTEHLFPLLVKEHYEQEPMIERATILSKGELTPRFSYLKEYAETDG